MVELVPVQLSLNPPKTTKKCSCVFNETKGPTVHTLLLRIDSQAEIGNFDIHYLTRTSQCAKAIFSLTILIVEIVEMILHHRHIEFSQ